MPETLRDLVVTLSLNTDNFSRNINSINRQIREAESAFRLAGAGVQNYSQTTDGMANRLSMLNTNLGRQRDAVSQYERALAQANSSLSGCFIKPEVRQRKAWGRSGIITYSLLLIYDTSRWSAPVGKHNLNLLCFMICISTMPSDARQFALKRTDHRITILVGTLSD